VGRSQALLGSVSPELRHIADRPVLVITDAAAEPASRCGLRAAGSVSTSSGH
jgi:hypothetical protein